MQVFLVITLSTIISVLFKKGSSKKYHSLKSLEIDFTAVDLPNLLGLLLQCDFIFQLEHF
jgi:hypothetical protein